MINLVIAKVVLGVIQSVVNICPCIYSNNKIFGILKTKHSMTYFSPFVHIHTCVSDNFQ